MSDFDPWGNYYFSLEIDKEEVANFMECSGLKTSAAVFEIEEGGFNSAVRKRVGQSKWENIVLKRAVDASHTFVEWRDKYLQGKFDERVGSSGAIVMRNNQGEEIRRYTFNNAFPVSWEGPSMSGGGSELAIETLEIAHDGLFRAPTPTTPPPQPQPPTKPEPGPINFDFDDQHPQDPPGVNAAEQYGENMADEPPMNVYVEGHTDSVGSAAYNQTLSEQRARNTAELMKGKAPQHNYITTGYSEHHPIASNSTQAGRDQNRRCEVYYEPLPPSGMRPGWLK